MAEKPIDMVAPESEQKGREKTRWDLMLDGITEKVREEFESDIADTFAKYEVPKRDRVPDLAPKAEKQPESVRVERVNSRGEEVHRLTDPTEYLYSRMPKEERKIRSPEADHWMREWIVGQHIGDAQRMAYSNAKLEAMFATGERATTLEGVAGSTGAFSTGTGGVLIPRPLEALVMIARDRVSKMPRFARTYNMTAFQHNIPTAASMTAAMTTEGATAAQGEPTLSFVTLTARKCQVYAVASIELLEDSATNLVTAYSELAGRAIGAVEEAQFFRTGTGSAPNVSAFLAYTAFAETTSGTLSYALDLVRMYYAVPTQYRDGAVWMGGNVLRLLTTLLDGNGRPFFQGMQERPAALTDDGRGAVGTLLGHPVYEVDVTAGTLHFGDPMLGYAIGRRSGITAESSRHVLFASDRVAFKWTARFDGNNVDTSAGQTVSGITAVTT